MGSEMCIRDSFDEGPKACSPIRRPVDPKMRRARTLRVRAFLMTRDFPTASRPALGLARRDEGASEVDSEWLTPDLHFAELADVDTGGNLEVLFTTQSLKVS